MEEMAQGRDKVPHWLVKGRTVLIPKDNCQGKPDQFWPIACLNTAYKVITSSVAMELQQFVTDRQLIPPEQKVLRKGRRGCLDALMVDAMVGQEAQISGRISRWPGKTIKKPMTGCHMGG